MAKKKSMLWAYGLLLIAMGSSIGQTILSDLCKLPVKNYMYSFFFVTGVFILVIFLKKLLNFHNRKLEKFFISVELDDTRKKRKTKLDNGEELLLSLPMGKCISDYNKHKEAFEQYFGCNVDFTYESKAVIKATVTNKNP